MNGRLNRRNQTQRISQRTNENLPVHYRRPFWLPASNYYILTLSVTVAFFFLVWGILHEGDEETPFIVAGVGASLVLGSAVVIREIFLRKARHRYLSVERKLDYNVKNFSLPANLSNTDFIKLTLEKNAAIIKEIQKKSETARGLGNFSNGHLEVLKICNKYLSVAEKQLETVRVGSPRLAGLRRGREIIGELHRYHLLSWTEIEARELTQKARNYITISEKLNTAQEALNIVESALQFYPREARLTESESALKDFIASIKISHWIEQAERSAFKGNYKRAISLYRDALFFLDREDLKNEDREVIADKINVEIESLRQLSVNKKLL
ncbi:MAG: hypothetical protein M3R14_03750 [Acidobacteriota bacterium]|nr:hypothetical protein [Acidobacteriota bacterium]